MSWICDIEQSMNNENTESGLRCLVLDLNSFFASCEQQECPELRGHPVAVVPVMANTTCAIAASYAAKAFGIRTGTPVWEAKKRCPGLKIVLARPKLYVQYHNRILQAIDSCIPIDEVMSIDEVSCRLDKIQQHPAEARHLAVKIKAAISRQVGDCLTSSVGIAANKLLAKLASNMQKPDGLVILQNQDMPQAILHLRLQSLPGIGPNMAVRLERAGIRDMAALWQADGQRLRHIWNGIGGVRFHELLHGADLASVKTSKQSISHQHVLAPDQRSIEKSTEVIRQLTIRAAQRLRDGNLFCRRLILHIKWMQDFGYYVREYRLSETQDTSVLLQALMPLWKQAPKLKPLRIGVTLLDLVGEADHQPDLFDKPKPAHLTNAIDELNAKFGRGAVTFGTSMPYMVSKIAFQRVPDIKEF